MTGTILLKTVFVVLFAAQPNRKKALFSYNNDEIMTMTITIIMMIMMMMKVTCFPTRCFHAVSLPLLCKDWSFVCQIIFQITNTSINFQNEEENANKYHERAHLLLVIKQTMEMHLSVNMN